MDLETIPAITRQTTDRDFLGENILLLYKANKLAIQCINLQELLIDQTPYVCTNNTLEWFPIPQEIRDKTTGKILSGHNMFRTSMLTHNLKSDLVQSSVFASLGAFTFILICCLPCLGALICKPKCLVSVYSRCVKKARKSSVAVPTNDIRDTVSDTLLAEPSAPEPSAPAANQQPPMSSPNENDHLEQLQAMSRQMAMSSIKATNMQIKNRQLEQQIKEQNRLVNPYEDSYNIESHTAPVSNDLNDSNDRRVLLVNQAGMILDNRAQPNWHRLATRDMQQN